MIIRKKIKGKKAYYYLEHSIRKGNKVAKKEKYLGTSIPKDIEKIKEEFNRDLKIDIYGKFERIKENFQVEWKKIPESVREKELEEISIAFTYNTNAIEGSTITLEEVREIIVDKIAPNKPLKDIWETEAHFKVFLDMLDKREKISKELLLKWHKEIFGETKPDISGRFRNFLVRVGPYVAPHWKSVEKLMKDFVEFVNLSKINAVELAARAHYRFEKVHPFGDGNGRIGRLIINHILWRNGYP